MTERAGGAEGAPARRRRDASATRRALLEAAHARFVRLGYDRTTLRDVAADVGVNLALIKRYFGSKEGLFKAALAENPRFPGGGDAFPGDLPSLAEALAHQLAADTWPEFGEHPVLMLLRPSGDPEADALRRAALRDFAHQILQSSEATGEDALLRAQLVVALGIGVAVLRSTVALPPLSDASAETLAGPLEAALTALLAGADQSRRPM